MGQISIPDGKAGVMIQSKGEDFRNFRNGPLLEYGKQGLIGIAILLIFFFLLRGRIMISAGPAAGTVTRFNFMERFVHWLTAGPFIILALTGLNMMYGKHVVLPVVGPEAFGALTYYLAIWALLEAWEWLLIGQPLAFLYLAVVVRRGGRQEVSVTH